MHIFSKNAIQYSTVYGSNSHIYLTKISKERTVLKNVMRGE